MNLMNYACLECGIKLTDDTVCYSNLTRCKTCSLVCGGNCSWGYKPRRPASKEQIRVKNRIKNKKSWENNQEKLKSYYRQWYENNGRNRKRNAAQSRAHYLVSKAIKSKELFRPKNCCDCNKSGKIEAHHNDYNKPLDVSWLCRPCHRWLHPGH